MNSFLQFITVLAIFIIVLIVTYAVTRWIGNFQKGQYAGGNIEVIESARISPSVIVEIVRIGNKYVALSVSKDNSSYICDIPAEDIVFKEDTGVSALSFDSILSRVRDKMDSKTGQDDVASDHRDE